MAESFSFKITANNIDEVMKAKDEYVERALEAIGAQVENYAKLKCPVDTGNLRNSITHQYSTNEQAEYVGTPVEYAAYVELGTSRMKAQPYLKPAVMDHVDELKRIAEAALKW